MLTLRRSGPREDVSLARGGSRPVLLATLEVPFDEEAAAFAVDSAVECGQELIVAVDRISMPLVQHDLLILCSDGLHGVLEDRDIMELARDLAADHACRKLVDAANERGTADNLTVAVFRMIGPTPNRPVRRGWAARLRS